MTQDAQKTYPAKAYPALPLPLPQAWRAMLALCIGFFMILLDQTIVAVATPAIQADLGADYTDVIWVTSVYLLTYAVPLLVTGRMGDRWGPKNVYIAGMVVFTLSSLACGLAPTIELLIVARAVQGLGAAMLTPQTMSVVNRIFPKDKRGAALGIWGATAGLSSLSGPLLGGVITEVASWNWVFYINVPIGILSVIMVSRTVPRFRPTEHPIDGLSIFLSVVAMSSLVFAIQEGERVEWAWWIWALMALSVVVVFLFIRRQAFATSRPAKEALIPLDLFRRAHFAYGNLAIFAMGFSVAGMMVPVMLYLQQVHHMSPFAAGCMMIPMAAISGLLAPYVGRAVDRHDPGKFAVTGFVLMMAGNLALVLTMKQELSYWWVTVPMVLLGFGNAFVWSPNSTSTLRELPPELSGAGSGMYNTTRQLGAVVGTAIIGAVLQARILSDPAHAFGQSMIPAVIILALGVWASWPRQHQVSVS